MSSLHLIIGPMFSGKSTELIRRCTKFSIARHPCILVKYAGDTRFSNDNIITHDNNRPNDLQVIRAHRVSELSSIVDQFSVIGIDEGQFFEDIYLCNNLANSGKIVIIAALDSNFRQFPFINITNIICNCETVTKLHAVCMNCFVDNASFTVRTTAEDALEVIGGSDKYMSICRMCCNQFNSVVRK